MKDINDPSHWNLEETHGRRWHVCCVVVEMAYVMQRENKTMYGGDCEEYALRGVLRTTL